MAHKFFELRQNSYSIVTIFVEVMSHYPKETSFGLFEFTSKAGSLVYQPERGLIIAPIKQHSLYPVIPLSDAGAF